MTYYQSFELAFNRLSDTRKVFCHNIMGYHNRHKAQCVLLKLYYDTTGNSFGIQYQKMCYQLSINHLMTLHLTLCMRHFLQHRIDCACEHEVYQQTARRSWIRIIFFSNDISFFNYSL